MRRILLIGKHGQLGWELNRTLQSLGELVAIGRVDLDVTDESAVHSFIEETKPNIIINAAGYDDVDKAENNADMAFAVNATGARFLAEGAARCGAFFLSYSSDYVFDGKKGVPYLESDAANPINVYGKSKLDGEQAIQSIAANYLILRSSSIFSNRRSCFLTKFLAAAQSNPNLKVVTDLTSNPTSARYVAEISAQIVGMGGEDYLDWLSERKGIYHLAGQGYVSRFEWALAIREILDLSVEIIPGSSSEFDTPARRPAFTALDTRLFKDVFHLYTPAWREMLELALADME